MPAWGSPMPPLTTVQAAWPHLSPVPGLSTTWLDLPSGDLVPPRVPAETRTLAEPSSGTSGRLQASIRRQEGRRALAMADIGTRISLASSTMAEDVDSDTEDAAILASLARGDFEPEERSATEY